MCPFFLLGTVDYLNISIRAKIERYDKSDEIEDYGFPLGIRRKRLGGL